MNDHSIFRKYVVCVAYCVVQTEQTSKVRKMKEASSVVAEPTIASTATPLSSSFP